jgi:hypothetical protein
MTTIQTMLRDPCFVDVFLTWLQQDPGATRVTVQSVLGVSGMFSFTMDAHGVIGATPEEAQLLRLKLRLALREGAGLVLHRMPSSPRATRPGDSRALDSAARPEDTRRPQ